MNTIHKADKQLSSLISRIGQNEGFSMISAIMALMVGTLLSLAAWATANSDIAFTDKDKWARLAYQRAQSGISDYVQHMAEDSGYWKACDRPDGVTGNGLGQTALNDKDISSSNTQHNKRRWLPYSSPGTPTDLSYHAQYTIDLQPITGTCKPSATASDRMIDNNSGTFKIAVTGRAGPRVPPNLTAEADIEAWRQNNWKRATIVSEFRRNGFLDYGYFTDHEGKDPSLQPTAYQEPCDAYYQDNPGYDSTQPRSDQNIPGRWRTPLTSNSPQNGCTEIQFANGDRLQGPFHTNDSVLLGSAPSNSTSALFGNANKGDRIEIYDNGKGNCPVRTANATLSNSTVVPTNCYRDINNNTGTTFVYGPGAKYLDLPEDNDDLYLYSDPASGDPDSQGLRYNGKTTIRFKSNGKLDITNNGVTETDKEYPTSGVIYVSNLVANCASKPYNATYATSIPTGCAQVEVNGTYNKSLTIGSAGDIVITGNLVRGTSQTAVLGLIANQYVRVRHYSSGTAGSTTDENYINSSNQCRSDGVNYNTSLGEGTVNNVQAAILTLNNSFTFDGYSCGDYKGNLNFTGALAQRWRGAVGTGSCSSSGTGYCKNYAYDYTFKSQTPPHFLAPSAATWKIIRLRQTLPACNCKSDGT